MLPPPPPVARGRSMSAASHLFGGGPPTLMAHQSSAPSALAPAYEDEPQQRSSAEAAALVVGRVTLAESCAAAEEGAVADLAALCLWHVGCLLAKQATHTLAKSRGVKPTDRFEAFTAKLRQQA
jgi:hypothetical protein